MNEMPANKYSYKEINLLRILYVLGTYILMQTAWWGYLLFQANSEKIQSNITLSEIEKHAAIRKSILMIAGEGIVFIVLLLIGFIYLKRTISRQLNLAKKEQTFLLSVTHELKTPVAAIKLFLETFKLHKLTPEQSVQLANDALKETNRLESLTENILLTTRIDQRATDFHEENVNLSELCEHVAKRMQHLSGKQISLSIQPEIFVRGDSQMLQVMCNNLIENSLKYAAPEPNVRIELTRNNQTAQLTISDHGPGISADEQHKIFEKFYRTGDESIRKHKGTGLGLYLVKNIVQLHHGKINLRPNEPRGVRFSIQLNAL